MNPVYMGTSGPKRKIGKQNSNAYEVSSLLKMVSLAPSPALPSGLVSYSMASSDTNLSSYSSSYSWLPKTVCSSLYNSAGRRYLVSRHSCSKFFPKVVESLVVARQGDVLPDSLRVQALSKVELSISDQSEVGSEFITGNSVKLTYHRCKWGSSSHLKRSVKQARFANLSCVN